MDKGWNDNQLKHLKLINQMLLPVNSLGLTKAKILKIREN